MTRTRWPVHLESGDIGLRPLRRRDEAEWTRVRRENADWLGPWDATSPVEGSGPRTYAAMWRELNRQAKAGQGLPFAVTLSESARERPRLVGQLSVSSITYGAFRSCTMGYWVAADVAGRGIAPTAVALAADHCFTELGLHRVEINIRPENGPSLRVAQKLGFRSEGLRRRFLHIDGDWRDHESFALTAEEAPEGVLRRFLEDAASRGAAGLR